MSDDECAVVVVAAAVVVVVVEVVEVVLVVACVRKGNRGSRRGVQTAPQSTKGVLSVLMLSLLSSRGMMQTKMSAGVEGAGWTNQPEERRAQVVASAFSVRPHSRHFCMRLHFHCLLPVPEALPWTLLLGLA